MISEKNTKQELLEEYQKLIAQVKSKKKTIPADIRSVSSKNTKAVVWSAIQKLQEMLAVAAPAIVTEQKQIQETPVSVIQPVNEPVNPKNAEPCFAKHDTEIKEENDLNYLNQEIIEEINALNAAKAMKEKEYQNLCAVETELKKFAEMINDFKSRSAKQEENHAAEETAQNQTLDELMEKAEENNRQKIEDAETSLKEAEERIIADKKRIAEERAVEEEKYDYEKSRKYMEEDDKWSDESARREEEIQNVEKETAALQAEIDAKAQHVAELTAKIDEIPALLETAKKEASEAKEKELNKEHGYKKHMAQKDADASIQSLERQIAHVKADYETALAEKNAIQDKLDKAYEESNRLYMQTVQSTGGIKILSNSDKN